MRRVERPEAEIILEELGNLNKVTGNLIIKSYDPDNPSSLELENTLDEYIIDPKVCDSIKLELIFRIFCKIAK